MKIIALGSSALMDGFSLIGIKTYADQSAEAVDTLLTELVRQHQTALVFMQQDLFEADIPMVHQLRNKGGSILLCEIPRLQAADTYQPEVELLVGRVLGQAQQADTAAAGSEADLGQ